MRRESGKSDDPTIRNLTTLELRYYRFGTSNRKAAMFANYLIGLREGLEAALIVSILLAYVVRTDQRQYIKPIWIGTALATALSLATGALLQITSSSLSDSAQQMFAGVTSLVAVGLITWMIFWMAARARHLRAELESSVEKAIAGGAVTLAVMAFVAVIREGLETALFLWTGITATSTGDATPALAGAILGLATAVVIGVGLYKGAITIDLRAMFRLSGIALVVVAAGVLTYAVHEFQEVGILGGEELIAYDISSVLPPDSTLAALLRGFFNFRPVATWMEVGAWWLYAVPTLTLFLQRSAAKSRPRVNA